MKIEALKSMETETILKLPDLDSGSQSLVDIRNHYYRNFGSESSGKEVLDNIHEWWNGFENTRETMSRFRRAITLPYIPPLEQQQSKEEYAISQQRVNQVVRGIVLLSMTTKPTDRDWDKVGDIETTIKKLERWEKHDNQFIAFCEAAGEAGDKILAAGIRQRIAQHSWDEMTALFGYAKINRVSTIDDIDSEKRELLDAIRGHLWSEDEIATKAQASLGP